MAITINGTTGVSGVDGSASTPALQGSDTNTGVSFGTDTVNINTGGSTKVSIDSAGALDVPSTLPIKVNGSEKLRLDDNGRLLLGTDTSAGTAVDLKLQAFHPTNGSIIIGSSNVSATGTATINFAPSNKVTGSQILCTAEEDFSVSANRTARLGFFTRLNGTLTERMRIDSYGNILFNTTSESNITNGSAAAFQFLASGQGQSISTTSTGFKYQMRFYNPNGQVGYISTQNSATQFNTSSDYRLKENVTAISDGITRLKTLKPSRFNFKVDKDITVDGFLAHEVSSIVPEAITGTKDEVVTQAMIDAGDYKEGTLNDPIYQGIDQSKLVPLLTAALQEAITKIETLETKVAALEAA